MALADLPSQTQPEAAFTPYLPPPPGVTSNPTDPDQIVVPSDVTIGLGVSLVTLFFLLRVYSRVFIKRSWIFEDFLVTLSWIGCVILCALAKVISVHHGGVHGWDVDKAQAADFSYWFNVASAEYSVAIGVAKLAILFLYRRIFSPNHRTLFDRICLGLIAVIVGFYTSMTIVKIWACKPRAKAWDSSIRGQCLNQTLILDISGGGNMVLDYLILFVPFEAVRKLHMKGTKRILIIIVFTFGLCAPVFATVGFVNRLQNSANPDKTRYLPRIQLWAVGELVSSVLSVCLPELGVLFRATARKNQAIEGIEGRQPAAAQDDPGPKQTAAYPSHPLFTPSLMGTAARGDEETDHVPLTHLSASHTLTASTGSERRDKLVEDC